ncbi:PREDICTED: ATP synthase subunit g, mitochondrial-like [Amphimedon queenslandica]|uniref:ATP synthase subunit n=1 Tax=Amphimedon queenslandica TaxID=400682 RepID=A0A1X7V1Q5_AMPQE|nr:PREDICTED: ATP synthase subunit g, mitochondrial-like [Amphimedon queenslandica]|eukprot:XP_003386054.1 PREDICTED: ATP synthase subunit g, mitochondrial-like [Amphimedon queenslandica]
MAQKLVSFGTKLATSSSRLVFKSLEKSQDLANRSRPHLKKFWSLARVELDPPRPSQWPEIQRGLAKVAHTARTGAFLNKPMKEVVQQSLVGFDIFCWFIVGEMIGRWSIIGYNV